MLDLDADSSPWLLTVVDDRFTLRTPVSEGEAEGKVVIGKDGRIDLAGRRRRCPAPTGWTTAD
jgi:hypothetical protein